ncbi:uncharacterized protein LOC128092591 [Culex pipiens pallens]|uniref:uncharacterized protein LOC128092591 n=1 Tax=Culex pipiens pallens TaxID=42434 RepID=UPI0022AA78F1|nr:uncharacterized protein LOC128092591 [Culex pipiens pallens]
MRADPSADPIFGDPGIGNSGRGTACLSISMGATAFFPTNCGSAVSKSLQEVCWEGKDHREYGGYTMYWSGGDTHELGAAFIVLGEMAKRVIGWWPVNDRMCRLIIKGRFFTLSIINVHSPHMRSDADDKDAFYELLDREYRKCPKHDVKIVIGDLNA